MIIFPAIDLFQGEAVRLYKGDYNQKTVYSTNPVNVALDFKNSGATHIHLVDLEGAKFGSTPNLDLILEIKKQSNLFVEVGGGIRSLEVVKKYIENGIDRIILGTVAVENPDFVKEAVSLYHEKIAVGIDIKNGSVAVKGWTEESGLNAFDFALNMQKTGVKTLICTDISKDGAMQGSNNALYEKLSKTLNMQIIASGGVSSIADVIALKKLNLYGAIIGKAYYVGAIKLQDAIKECL